MDKGVVNHLTSIGLREVRFYENDGSAQYYDAELWTGQRVEVRLRKTRIHYRLFGQGDPVHPEWLELGPMAEAEKGRGSPPEASGQEKSPAEHGFSDSTQLSIFDEPDKMVNI